VVDIDQESIAYLAENKIVEHSQLIHGDFLKMDLKKIFGDQPFGIIGNFPYNISTQILFQLYDHRGQAMELVGMFQKEVAERVVSPPGSKVYGITSVLLQAFYDVEYLFTVDEHDFDPPPKVKSAVIRLKRNQTKQLDCDEKKFKQIVKMAFNQRRKTLRNGLKALINQKPEIKSDPIFNERAEQLSVEEFVHIVHLLN
jgi:16S rRNA (adenine1518-N6/adenine1519-N6)-dimethyltransferase